MPRSPIQDVVPPERRSIRNVTLPNRTYAGNIVEPISLKRDSEKINDNTFQRSRPDTIPHHTSFRLFIWFIAILAVLFFTGMMLMVFAKATVTVFPHQVPITIETTIIADTSGAPDSLPYETISLGKISNVTVPATGTEFVNRKAQGTITIFNNFSATPQRLIKNTRFESPTGLIYRIDESVTIPGRTTKNGVVVPGSIEATVYADESGPTYNNNELTTFTIPGFKDDPSRYSKFYAESKTSMSGGFMGTVPKVDDATRNQKYVEMEGLLKEKLVSEIFAALPNGFISFPESIVIATSSFPTIESPEEEGKAIIQLAATATAFIFPENSFSEKIASISIPEFDKAPVRISDFTELQFTLDRAPSLDNPTLSFSISGETAIIWLYDKKALTEALLGQPTKNTGTIIGRFSALKGEPIVQIQPFFKRSFPATPKRITIIDAVE